MATGGQTQQLSFSYREYRAEYIQFYMLQLLQALDHLK